MIALVTGARSGFGLLTAIAAAKAGHTVYAGLRDPDNAPELREAAASLPIRTLALDVVDPAQRAEALARITREEGAPDVLVNNAGIAIAGPLEELSEAEIRKVFEVNLFGLWELTRLCLPGMRARQSGLIVNVSSMAGRTAMPCLGAYAASKHALTGLSESLRQEVHGFGIRVALIEPGPYATDIFGRNRQVAAASTIGEGPYGPLLAAVERLSEKIIANAGDPSDVAAHIVGLFGDRAPGFRHPMGPTTAGRRLVRWLLPHSAFEAIVRRAIARA